MGGAQPLAATMAGAAILCVEVDPSRIERRLETRYLDESTDSLDDALARVRAAAARAARRSRSGCSGTRPTSCPSSPGAASAFDLVTDQTAAHDPLNGYVPAGLSRRGGGGAAARRPGRVPATSRARRSRAHVEGMLEYVRAGQLRFRLRQQPPRGGA